jgi:hypothetical protein
MPGDIDMAKLSAALWQEGGDVAYAVLDGAGIANLLDRLYAEPQPKFVCLLRGELKPDMAEVAPYLVKLQRDSEFFEWVLSGWGNAWGIFVVAPDSLDLGAVRRHLRKLNLVTGPRGETLLFRYYDPRVLRILLPTCDERQRAEIFGPLRRILVEAEEPGLLQIFALAKDGNLIDRQVALAA